MNTPRIAFLIVALLFATSVDLFAQQQEPPVAPGDRVRVTAPSEVSGRFVGTVMEIGADTCVLEVEGRAEPLALPLAPVTTLEVWRERPSKAAEGAALGLFVGGLAGAVFGVAACERYDKCGAGPGTAAAAFGGIGAGAGLLIGAGIGNASGRDRWETVPLDQLRVGLVRQRNGRFGLAVSASIVF